MKSIHNTPTHTYTIFTEHLLTLSHSLFGECGQTNEGA
jgi:hypothetical protein